MNTAEPIRNTAQLERIKQFYVQEYPNPRNRLLVIMGLNTALRVSDILSLQWRDVYDFRQCRLRSHIVLTEQKTGKSSRIFMNQNLTDALLDFLDFLGKTEDVEEEAFIFQGKCKAPLSRSQVWRIIRKAASSCEIEGVISPHSLRKTFGYMAWKNDTSTVMLMNIFNHSSFEITKRYLGISQEDRDDVFRKNCL